MDIQRNGFLSIGQMTERYPNLSKKPTESQSTVGESSFRQLLVQKELEHQSIKELKFSKHASVRLNDRGIELTREQMARLSDGTRRAAQKGIQDSLVIVDELAFIVNVPNNTVITAMDSTDTKESVFTNINGAVIA